MIYKTFSNFLSEEEQFWDNVISEGESKKDYQFQVYDRLHKNKTIIGNHSVQVRSLQHKDGNGTQHHTLDFDINNDINRLITKRTHPHIKKQIIHHVGSMVAHYVHHNIVNIPGKHVIKAASIDTNEKDEEKKDNFYNKFFFRLAKKTGGHYEKTDSGIHKIHYEHR